MDFDKCSTAAGQPNLNLTPEEKRVFYQLFQTADKTNLGVVTGEVAVSFFERTGLPAETLGLVGVLSRSFTAKYSCSSFLGVW
jgi:hypothetical protein